MRVYVVFVKTRKTQRHIQKFQILKLQFTYKALLYKISINLIKQGKLWNIVLMKKWVSEYRRDRKKNEGLQLEQIISINKSISPTFHVT